MISWEFAKAFLFRYAQNDKHTRVSIRRHEFKKTVLCENYLADKTHEGTTSEKIFFRDTDPIVTYGLNIFRSGRHSGAFYREL